MAGPARVSVGGVRDYVLGALLGKQGVLSSQVQPDRVRLSVRDEVVTPERDVVLEERRMRTDSTPLGKFQEEFAAMFWESCSYAWPTIGWPRWAVRASWWTQSGRLSGGASRSTR